MAENRNPSFICPSPEGWVAWQQAENGTWSDIESAPAETKPWDLAAAKGHWILGLPLRSLQTLAMKVPTAEGTNSVDEVVPLRLEAAGLDAGSGKLSLADWTLASQKSDSSVVMVWTMDGAALDGCPGNRVPAMAVAAFNRWKWSAKELVLWCEAGRWLAAFSSDSCPVHVQPCVSTDDITQLASDLRGQATTLLLRGLAPMPDRLVVRGGSAAFASALATELGLPLAERPDAPEILPLGSRLVSKEMLAAREAKIEAGKWRIRIAAAAAVWLAVAGYAGYGYFEARNQLAQAQQQHETVSPQATRMREVQDAIDIITSANSVEALPLEVLARLTPTMPPSDFRLTTFTVEGDRDVYLKGSAKRQDLALRFAQDLRRNKELGAYTWETPYPVNEKDGTATFTYQGKFRTNAQP